MKIAGRTFNEPRMLTTGDCGMTPYRSGPFLPSCLMNSALMMPTAKASRRGGVCRR